MPFCPKCRFEYEADVAVCPDCDMELVADRPPDPDEEESEYKNWIPLARLTSEQYAEMIQERLEQVNIPVVILSGTGHFGYIGTMGPSSFAPVGGGYTVMVPEEFAADADIEGQAMLGDDWTAAKLVDIDEEEDAQP